MRGLSAAPWRDGIEPQHANATAVGLAVPLEDLHRRRLASAVRSEQREHFSRLNLERQPVDDGAAVVALDQVADFDRGRCLVPSFGWGYQSQ